MQGQWKTDHHLPAAPSRLDQDFSAEAANQKWLDDITWLWTDDGRLYLATLIDLDARRVVGWPPSERMQAKPVCDALQMALWRRKRPKGGIVHCDRESQYRSRAYQALLEGTDPACSMSGVGNGCDDAVAERLAHALKVELTHGEPFASRAVFDFIESDYNRIQRRSALGHRSPVAFEAAPSSVTAVSTVRGQDQRPLGHRLSPCRQHDAGNTPVSTVRLSTATSLRTFRAARGCC